jgi:acyl-coenzyme A synthetase/AMP-(fatty) acid ligase
MNMPRNERPSLRRALGTVGDRAFLRGEEASLCWSDLLAGTVLAGRADEFGGRSIVIAVSSQIIAAAALIELDRFAQRVILYPPDLSLEHLDFVAECADVDIILSDRMQNARDGVVHVEPSAWRIPESKARGERLETEWVLLTSGTTGRPKLVVHTLASLTGAIGKNRPRQGADVVWSTFYDIRRYGGLQIFLRAVVTGTSMVLSSAHESTADFLARAAANGVTHISGTPSHWRRALMSPAAHRIAPEYVRLSGEIADQAILNQLRATYPQARIGHAFATTEAGLAFDVNDGQAGFPAEILESTPDVEMKVENCLLQIRSNRTARRYLGGECALRDAEGFVNTGDVLELREDRYHFAGRGDGMINVGGMKVFPEEVEAVINGHPGVEMSLVRTRKNSITGALVIADVVLKSVAEPASTALRIDILRLCRETLPAYKVPAMITFVPSLAVAETGKLIRRHA